MGSVLIALMALLLGSGRIDLDGPPLDIDQAFARKHALGEAAFLAEVDAAVDQRRARGEATGHCLTPAQTATAAQLGLVGRAADAEAWTSSRAAGDAALARRQDLRALYLSGAQAPRPYGLVSRMAARAKAEPDPRLAQLYQRMAEDQFSRIDSLALRPFLGPGVHTAWEAGLDEPALA